jgi:hypothetical protein
MNEMQCDKNKIEYIQGKTQDPPSNHAMGIANTKPPPTPRQRSKMSRIKRFGENVS